MKKILLSLINFILCPIRESIKTKKEIERLKKEKEKLDNFITNISDFYKETGVVLSDLEKSLKK